MSYRDSWTTCEQCGREFVFRIEEQRRLDSQGQDIVPPAKCPACRGVAHTTRAQRPAPRSESFGRQPRSPRPREAPKPEAKPPLGHGPHEGEVKWFSLEKGYGFLLHQEGQEIFFHRSSLAPGEAEHLRDGARVSFMVEETERGPQAVDVERLE
jgi:CspA family cold shock protein